MNEIFDILIIGAGVVGAMIARTLSQYVLKVVVVDKSNDAGNATSSANTANSAIAGQTKNMVTCKLFRIRCFTRGGSFWI